MKLFKLFITLAIIALAGACSTGTKHDSTVIKTKYGKVKGYAQDSVLVFKGIPYARAERFKMPQEPLSWDSVMDCTEFGDICIQEKLHGGDEYVPTDTVYTMSENCQNLNIWTSSKSDGGNRPVMVWLHGGGFNHGNSHHHVCFDGHNLVNKEDVVLVTVNHRLHCLGYMDLSEFGDEYKGSGNAGMADIVAALQWVKENISAFGGDPNNVTIFGHGSGGIKVFTLLAMPSATGLYHKAIVQSGALEGMNQQQSQARLVTRTTMEKLGVTSPDDLKDMPVMKIYDAAMEAISELDRNTVDFNKNRVKFAPVVDGYLLPKPVFTDSCANVNPNTPIIMGSTFSEYNTRSLVANNYELKRDAHMLTAEELEEELEKRFGDKKEAVKTAFMHAYPNRPLCEVLSLDTAVRSQVIRMANLLAKRGDTPLYIYMFSWVTPLRNGYAMSFRNSELPFIFNNPEKATFSRVGGTEARRLARIMSRCWASFARSGNPNNSITPYWRRVNHDQGYTMMFDRDVRLEVASDLELMRILHPEDVKDVKDYAPTVQP